MKAHWSEVETQLRNGESCEVFNRGKATALIVAAAPRSVLVWNDHLATAIPTAGRSAEETMSADREGRW